MQGSSWADGLELVGDDDRLVGFAGAVPLRLLAERSGLRAGLSVAMARRGFDPVYDRGQVLIDLAVVQVLGGEAISDLPGAAAPGPGDRAGGLDLDGVAGARGGRRRAAEAAERGEGWHTKIPDLRVIVRDEPLHPRYRKRATDREKQLGRRYQLIATNTQVGQLAWLDARHRSHVHVENDVKQAKDLGLNRWPSRQWAINVAWTQIVALAANLLARDRRRTGGGCHPPGLSRTRPQHRRSRPDGHAPPGRARSTRWRVTGSTRPGS